MPEQLGLLPYVFKVLNPLGEVEGTGFLCHCEGYALTCWHVLASWRAVGRTQGEVLFQGEKAAAIWVTEHSVEAADVAVLRLSKPQRAESEPWPYLPLDVHWRVQVSDQLHSFGYPVGQFADAGISIAPKLQGLTPTQVNGVEVFPLAGFNLDNINEGYSGAPVINERTEQVIGLVHAKQHDTQAFIVPLWMLFKVWPELRAAHEERKRGPGQLPHASAVRERRESNRRRKNQYLVQQAEGTGIAPADRGSTATVNLNSPSPVTPPPPHQLRAPVGDFVDRTDEYNQLVHALRQIAQSDATAAIAAIRGMGGIGKTELAYAVAQGVADTFPDAQIVLKLHGTSTNPLPPTKMLQTVIHAFEPPTALPDSLDELHERYLSNLSCKRVLVLVDDAKDANQVRLLLPPAGCALLITSRNHFSLPGMNPDNTIDLATLPPSEAEKLLLKICPRIGRDAAALAKLCGYLPLALRVSASLLADDITLSVEYYMTQLDMARLAHLRGPDASNDPEASVEASLRMSYDALDIATQSVFCQLSVFPASFDQAAAAAVVQDGRDIADVLGLLWRRSLLDWNAVVRRYVLHTLVRLFAAERLVDADAPRLRHAQHYSQIAARVAELYLKRGDSALAGLRLFDAERAQIDVGRAYALERAGDPKTDALLLEYEPLTAQIGDLRYNTQSEIIPQLDAFLAAAQRLERWNVQGWSLINLGRAYKRQGKIQKAIDFYEKGLDVVRSMDDRRNESVVLNNLGEAYAALGEAQKAIAFYKKALKIAHKIEYRAIEGFALNNLGRAYAALGEAQKAIAFYKKALKIAHKIEYSRIERLALTNLGDAYAALGETQKAIDCYKPALDIDRELGDRAGESVDLTHLGDAYAALGETQKAIDCYKPALDIDRELGDRYEEGVDLTKLGDAYMVLGKTSTAIDYYEQALVIDREFRDLPSEKIDLDNLGNSYHKLERYEIAIQYFTEHIKLLPDDPAGYHARAVAYWYWGHYEEAVKDFSREIELKRDSDSFKAYSGRGQVFAEMGEYKKAIIDLDGALEIEGGSDISKTYTRNGRALAYAGLGQYEKALNEFKECIKVFPENAWTYYNRALTYEWMGECEKAIADYKTALQKDKPPLNPLKREKATRAVALKISHAAVVATGSRWTR